MNEKTPRWKYWKKQKSWKLYEAASLLCGIEPPKTREEFEALCRRNDKVAMIFEDMCKSAESGELRTMPPLDS